MSEPIIIPGVFRSGTTYVTEALHTAGIPMYRYKNRDSEDLDIWTILQTEWTLNPPDRHQLPPAHTPSAWLMERLTTFRRERSQEAAWGFKDPAICWFWGAFNDVFPMAKWVVCMRNPLSAVRSQIARNMMKCEWRGMLVWQSYIFAVVRKIPEERLYYFNYDGDIQSEQDRLSEFVERQVDLVTNWKRSVR